MNISLEVRPAVAGDEERIVAIYNLEEPDMPPLTPARYRAECAEEPGERYVAVLAEQLVGYGSFRWAWWTGEPSLYQIEIHVDPGVEIGQIDTQLFAELQRRLSAKGAMRLLAWVKAGAEQEARFARLGFAETGQVIREYRLAIPEADTALYAEQEERLRQGGIEIVSLAEIDRTDTAFLQALQRLWADPDAEPRDPEQQRHAFETWRQQVLNAPGLTPETHWVALKDGQPVGTTFLKQTNEDAFENDYTAVVTMHRRRGIAMALKLRATLWGQQQGAAWFYTSSEVNNLPMITLNTRLGYRPGVLRKEMALALSIGIY